MPRTREQSSGRADPAAVRALQVRDHVRLLLAHLSWIRKVRPASGPARSGECPVSARLHPPERRALTALRTTPADGAGGDVRAAVLHGGFDEGEPVRHRRCGLDESPRQVAAPGCGTNLWW
ncbi:hypothetical protein GCM10018791_71710 [Streptomyces zaomyceticus]|nr:hypothetical protein GCM10018791_71710 [Streptomyces zaomyceticus]